MNDINFLEDILTEKFPEKEESFEGDLVFLKHHKITKLEKPLLFKHTALNFYKAKFSTGYRKFKLIDVIIGFSDKEVYILTNPIFSNKYSNLIQRLEEIKALNSDDSIINEIVDLYKQTGTVITELSKKKHQIWFGNNKWRILEFKIDDTLQINCYQTQKPFFLNLWRKQ